MLAISTLFRRNICALPPAYLWYLRVYLLANYNKLKPKAVYFNSVSQLTSLRKSSE